MNRPIRLGVLAWQVDRADSIAAFAGRLDRALAEAAPRCDLALLPEYACVELGAALSGSAGDAAAELRAMVDAAPALVSAMRDVAMRHGVWLVPGTLPMRDDDGVVNRAPLIAPGGGVAFQDKRFMTRFETEAWQVSAGTAPAVFATPWGRIGISVCYDIEFPKHARAQVEAGAWLILVPACTDTPAGAQRVRIGAQARAMENQCFVAVAPTAGTAPWSAALDVNCGTAAVYGPIDRGFAADGVVAAGPADTAGWVFATLDPARLDAVRSDGAVRNHRDWPTGPFPPPEVLRP